MPHLFLQDEAREWLVLPLKDEGYSLAQSPPVPLDGDPVGGAVLVRDGEAPAERWLLMTGGERRIWVNGLPLALGMRVVRDRDRIRVEGAGTVFLSTEVLPRVETFPGADTAVLCPRCRTEVEAGTAAVRCPGCGVWYHESPSFPCFTFAATCAVCPQPTDMSAGYRWVPEEEA
jgi:hypothetical protein